MNTIHKKAAHYHQPQEIKEKGLYPYFREIESEQDTVVMMDGKELLMFGSNSYMGLTNHPKVKEAAIKAVKKYGTGCAGSRFLNGNLDIHTELEREIADFVGKEEALVFSTGFQANLGVPSALIGRHDFVIIDECVHASIIDGCRLSFGQTLRYDHNDMYSLETILKKIQQEQGIKLIITDGVFSMEGDIANLPGIVELAKKYGASVMTDDAHALGVLGKNGKGTASHFGLSDDVDIIMGTFSKSLASLGGFIASSSNIINYLRHHSRSLIFSASIPPSAAASALASLRIIRSEPERITKLWDNTKYALEMLTAAGFDTGNTETPIIPIFIRDNDLTFLFTRMLNDEGVFVNPVVSPAVKNGDTLLRFSLMATHSKQEIDSAVKKIVSVGKRLGVLKKGKQLETTER
jgi:8-amino-7-oxononanoate synthase